MIDDLTDSNNGDFQKMKKNLYHSSTQQLLRERSRRKHPDESWSKAIRM